MGKAKRMSSEFGEPSEFDERLELVISALRKQEYGLHSRHPVDLLCTQAEKVLALPLDERHKFEDQVVNELEDIFVMLERRTEEAQKEAIAKAEEQLEQQVRAA